MKTTPKKSSTILTEFLVFVAGLASLFIPHFLGWSLIVFPSLSVLGVFLFAIWKIIFYVALALLLFHVVAHFILKASAKTKLTSVCFLAGLILTFLTIYPKFATNNGFGEEKIESAFMVGGQTRILWAGGLNNIKNDALTLLSQKPGNDGYIDPELWTNSLRKLGAKAIKIDKERQFVIIFIPQSLILDFDEFGYLITYSNVPDLDILKIEDYEIEVNHWRLGEGVYFFDRKW